MDNLAHSLVGLAAAKAGLDRLSPRATTACIIAANAADGDVVSGFFGGRPSLLHYHRGITHSLVGTLALGLLVPSVLWIGDRLIARLRNRPPQVRYRGLLIASVVVAATHPLMDWTNDYGVRLLLPWNDRWFYGDLMFIVDPFFWLIVGTAAFLLSSDSTAKVIAWSVLALLVTTFVILMTGTGNEIGHPVFVRVIWMIAMLALAVARAFRWHRRVGPSIAFASLAAIVAYWSLLGLAHHRAYRDASGIARQVAGERRERLVRQAVTPTSVDPFRWQSVVETDRAYYKFPISILDDRVAPGGQSGNEVSPGVRRFEKPTGREVILASLAARDPRAQAFLEFARFPFARAKDPECMTQTLVGFTDLRYNSRSTEPGTQRGTFSVDVPVDCTTK